MRGADVVARVLAEAGHDTIFALSGNQIMPIFDACLETGTRLIHTRHEAAAGYMAEGHAQATGRAGIALVTAGAGLGNAVAPLLTARASQTPLVLLSGDSPVSSDGRGAFQEMSQTAITASITKASVRVTEGADIADALREALRVAQSGQPGPVHLSLPADVLEGDAPFTPAQAGAEAAPLDIDSLVAALAQAARPLIVLGPDLGRMHLPQSLLGAPVVAMESPRGANDPALGRFKAAWAEADLVVALGKPVDFTLGFGAKGAWPAAKWITVHGDTAEVERATRNLADRLIEAHHAAPRDVAAQLASLPGGTDRQDWCDQFRQLTTERLEPSDEGVLSPVTLCSIVNAHLAGATDPVVVCDGGEFGQWAQALTTAPRRIINGPSGSIGGGICYAWGAKVACPGSDVVALMGDGTAGFHFMEFETAAREGLPFIAVIGNDRRWNAEHELQIRSFGADRTHSCGLSEARYDLAAAALGGFGAHVSDPDALRDALAEAAASGRPACIDVAMEGLPAPTF